jgi:hypothetical protein
MAPKDMCVAGKYDLPYDQGVGFARFKQKMHHSWRMI